MKHFRKIKRIIHNLTHPVIGEVWEFHRITNEPSAAPWLVPFDVTPKRLESLIVEYQRKGYQFVTIDYVIDYINHTPYPIHRTLYPIPHTPKFICITLDDGYRDNYENAYPIFKKYNIPFCIYITTGFIDGNFEVRYGTPPSMTSNQIKELAKDPLCTIAAHTVHHPHMPKLSDEEQKAEIVNSIGTLQQLTEKPIEHFTIPYGDYNDTTWRLLKECGVKSNVFGWGGPIRKGEKYDVYHIPRFLIEEHRKVK